MIKRESYTLTMNDLHNAIKDYLLKHNIIQTPDMISEIVISASSDGRDARSNVALVNEEIKVE